MNNGRIVQLVERWSLKPETRVRTPLRPQKQTLWEELDKIY